MAKIKNLIPNGKQLKKKAPKMLGAAGGGLGYSLLQKGAEKILPAEYNTPKIKIGFAGLLGVLLAANDEPLLEGAGLGVIGCAGRDIGTEFGLGDPIIGDVPKYIEITDVDAGPVSGPVIGGNDNNELGY